MDLHNETAVNVASLLQEAVGASREYRLELDRFALDNDLVAQNVIGLIRLTQLTDEILAVVKATATIELLCLRCLEPYVEETSVRFQEEFRVAYDVRTGLEVESGSEDERFEINDRHELDLAEPLRQELIVSLPMRPYCGDACAGPPLVAESRVADIDERFAALATLLNGTSDE